MTAAGSAGRPGRSRVEVIDDDDALQQRLGELGGPPPAPVAPGTRSWGPVVHVVRFAARPDKATLLGRLGRALSFPAWSRPNWDAFEESLADLGWLPPGGHVLVVAGLPPGDLRDTLVEVLRDVLDRPGVAANEPGRDVDLRALVVG